MKAKPTNPKRLKTVQPTAQDLDTAAKIAGIFSAGELVELLNNKWRFAWINFRAGLYRGIGTTVGVGLAIVILGYLVVLLGGLPIVGNFINDINQNLPTTSTQQNKSY